MRHAPLSLASETMSSISVTRLTLTCSKYPNMRANSHAQHNSHPQSGPNQNPYRIYGTQQDNTAISVPSYSVPRIQEMHGLVIHQICEIVENSI